METAAAPQRRHGGGRGGRGRGGCGWEPGPGPRHRHRARRRQDPPLRHGHGAAGEAEEAQASAAGGGGAGGSVRPSVCPSVRPSVHLSVGPSVLPAATHIKPVHARPVSWCLSPGRGARVPPAAGQDARYRQGPAPVRPLGPLQHGAGAPRPLNHPDVTPGNTPWPGPGHLAAPQGRAGPCTEPMHSAGHG